MPKLPFTLAAFGAVALLAGGCGSSDDDDGDGSSSAGGADTIYLNGNVVAD